MVEVASSNLAGPTKFLSLCFSRNLFFVFAESSRVVASCLYRRKVATKKLIESSVTHDYSPQALITAEWS